VRLSQYSGQALFFLEPQKAVAEGCIGVIIDILTFHFQPFRAVYFGEKGIAGKLLSYFCQVNGFGPRQHGLIQIGAADKKYFVMTLAAMDYRLVNIGKNQAAWLPIVRVSADDDIGATRQRAAYGFIGFSAHQDGRSHGDLFEFLKIGR